MKLDFSLLWIENEPDSVKPDKEGIETFLEEYGVQLSCKDVNPSVGENYKDYLSDDLDLIIVDLNLGVSEGDGSPIAGNEPISEMRQKGNFLPIIFYSQRGHSELREAFTQDALQGVFLSHRKDIRDTVEKFLESLLDHHQTPKQARGFLMEELSEIDSQCHQILIQAFKQLPENDKKELIDYAVGNLEKSNDENRQKVKDLPRDESLWDAYSEPPFFTINRFKVLLEALKKSDRISDEFVQVFHELNNGDYPLISKRNRYAHRTRSDLQADIGGDPKEEFKRIRDEVRRQIRNLDSLKEALE